MHFYFAINIEPGIIGEVQIPYHETEGNEITKRCTILCKDEEFILNRFGQDKTKLIEGALCDWINDGSISFISYQVSHYQSYLSKTDMRHYAKR